MNKTNVQVNYFFQENFVEKEAIRDEQKLPILLACDEGKFKI